MTDDHIVCLEDGQKLKMLKRHLMSDHGMTPEDYRAEVGPQARTTRWWRPLYAQKRRELAMAIGLGRKPEPAAEPKRQRRAKAG